jgi:hypothetical protein
MQGEIVVAGVFEGQEVTVFCAKDDSAVRISGGGFMIRESRPHIVSGFFLGVLEWLSSSDRRKPWIRTLLHSAKPLNGGR